MYTKETLTKDKQTLRLLDWISLWADWICHNMQFLAVIMALTNESKPRYMSNVDDISAASPFEKNW